MLCRITLLTDTQTPWPGLMISKIQEAIRSKNRALQETTFLLSLERWQYLQILKDDWVSETIAMMRSKHGMIVHDIKIEPVPMEKE